MPKDKSQTAIVRSGLSAQEVLASRTQDGANILTPPKRTPWWKLYFEKFDDPVIRILLIAAAIAGAVGAVEGTYIEGIGILCAVFLSTALAFVNEYQAAREFELLNRVTDDAPVRVIRNGQPANVSRKEIVVGDIVILETGQEIPADGDLLESVNLYIDESRLTGESEPAAKTPSVGGAAFQPPLAPPKALASNESDPSPLTPLPQGERGTGSNDEYAYPQHRLLRSTLVSEGYGTMRVTEVGDRTEAGQTAQAASEEREDITPLGRQLARLARVIGVVGFTIAAGLFAALVVRGQYMHELELSLAQWRFALLVLVSALVATVRIWLPIAYDAFELAGAVPPASRRPDSGRRDAGGTIARLTHSGFIGFAIALAAGAVIYFAGFALLDRFGALPRAPEALLPPGAAHEFLTIFMVAVTVVVVAVPEGLAMSVTLCLAYSVKRMSATNNLVRHMHACETIGAATVICSDKTGTLTLNQMRVVEADFPAFVERSSRSVAPESRTEQELRSTSLLFESMALNSTADLAAKDVDARVLGNPTEGALLLWLEEHGGDYAAIRSSASILGRLPFSTEHKFMCSLLELGPSRRVLHVKGAPEVLLARCSKILTASGPAPVEKWRAALDQKLHAFQDRGMRTLGFAFKECDAGWDVGELKDRARELIWLGFVAIQDPVRAEVPAAIQTCRRAGIAVKIVTGDNSHTAREIARQAGLWTDSEPAGAQITGPEFAALPNDRVAQAAENLKIMSRARPNDKLRLVKVLKAVGHVVAVTGDGTNDAPALNHANVGLAMGKSGSATAKEASDIVLLDDSFTSIVNAVKWGRSLYDNIQRFIVFQLTINVAALGLMILGPFAGVKLPLTVTQMLWINLIMDTMGALALASEPPHESVLDRPPRARDAFIISGAMARNILSMSLIFLAALLALLLFFKRDGELSRHESTIAFTVLVLMQFWNLFNARCFGRDASALRGVLQNHGFVLIAAAIVIGQFLIVQFGGAVFRTEPLVWNEWLAIFAGTSLVLWGGEIWRWFARQRKSR